VRKSFSKVITIPATGETIEDDIKIALDTAINEAQAEGYELIGFTEDFTTFLGTPTSRTYTLIFKEFIECPCKRCC